MEVIDDEEVYATSIPSNPTSPPPLPPLLPSSEEAEAEAEEEKESLLLCTEAGLRQLIRERLPTAESPPSYVRLWLAGYFTYRGIDSRRADRFLWSGAELQDLALPELVDAFRAKLMMGPRRARARVAARDPGVDEESEGDGDNTSTYAAAAATTSTTTSTTAVVTEAEVEMLALDVFNFIQSARPSFGGRLLARAGRLVSFRATMGERLDTLLMLVAYLGILFLVLASLSGFWASKGFVDDVIELLHRFRLWLGQLMAGWGELLFTRVST